MTGSLLLRHRTFGLLWVAGLISLTGDWLLGVALPVSVYRLTGSPAATSAVLAVSVGAALVAGTIAGVYVDRWDRRKVLVVANLLQVAAVLPLLAVTSAAQVWIVLVVAAVESTLGQFVAPAEHALLPQLVAQDDLGSANSLNTLNANIARLAGPALGAIVVAAAGLAGAAILDAASFAVAAVLVALIGGVHRASAVASAPRPAGRRPRPDRVSAFARWRAELAGGLQAIWASRLVRALLVVLLITSVGEGVMGSLFAVFADRGLTGGATDIGWLMSAQAVGGIAGGILSAAFARRIRPVPMLVVGYAVFGVIDVVIFNLPRWTPALAPQVGLFILIGIPGALAMAATMTLLQTEVADGLRGRVFAAFMVAQSAAALVGSGLAALLTDRLGVFTVLTAQGCGYVVAAGAFLVLARARAARRRRVLNTAELQEHRRLATVGHGVDALQRRWNV